jgi:mRNA deadenylase 3'-5' endonuclease subunit Ccr4
MKLIGVFNVTLKDNFCCLIVELFHTQTPDRIFASNEKLTLEHHDVVKVIKRQ